MTNIHVIVPVADSGIQDFTALVNDLCGNYVAEDHVEQSFDENGEPVETVVPNPYKDVAAPDYSNKITLVSHSALTAPAGADNVVVEGELNVSKLWNAGVAHAVTNGATHVVILNEVSSVNPHVFAESLEENDSDIVNLSDGGCFIVKPTVSANETFRWWFADLYLFNHYPMSVYRNEFIDIKQENAIPIDATMQAIVDADAANYSQQ